MSVYYINGDLLKSRHRYICHQVNCQGRMGSGIAKQIRERWPIVYEQYIAGFKAIEEESINWEDQLDVSEVLLGRLQQIKVNDTQTVINMFAQQYYGYDGKRYTSYDAFWACLGGIKDSVPKGSKIGFPYRIGCGLGGANWQVIETMIYAVLGNDFDVYIYILEEAK
jgi:O-acetyl-ADP-ribose deacetylase (regulator of RNase III)